MAYKIKETNKNLSSLKSADFKYNFKIWWKTLLHFPIVRRQSKTYVAELYRFLQIYPRNGILEVGNDQVHVNTVEHYLADAKKRGLTNLNFVYSPEQLSQIQETEIFNDQKQKISVLILKQPNAKKWVIGLHGWTENKYLALRQTYLYSQLGYNVLTFDARGHGNSYGDFTDIGYSTPNDLITILKWLEIHEGIESYGVIGNSMGGTSALKYAQDFGYQDPKLKFIVDDAGFNNLLTELRFNLANNFKKQWWKVGYGLPKIFTNKLGINFKNYDLMKKIPQIDHLPVLFIHGLDDNLVPVFNSKELYKAKIRSEKEPKSEILTTGGVKHIQMISHANPVYVATITKFLTTIGEIK